MQTKPPSEQAGIRIRCVEDNRAPSEAALPVVDLFNEPWNPAGDITEGLVAADVDVLHLERLHEALGLRMVVWVAGRQRAARTGGTGCGASPVLAQQKANPFGVGFLLISLVPERGIEPPTFALRMRCSTN